jgi:putative DNA primase/helicase
MEKISKDQLWGQIKSGTTKPAESLPQTDEPEPEEGGKPPDTTPLKVPEAKVAETESPQPPPSPPKPPIPKLNKEEEPPDVAAEAMEQMTTSVTQAHQETELTESRLQDFHLDQAERLMTESFPHPPNEGSRSVPATIPNVQHLLDGYNIKARYNVIKKAPEFVIPGLVSTVDNADNVALVQVKSLARLCGLSVSTIEEVILAIADRHQYNPVANWIMSKPWDGIDRLQAFYDTLTVKEGFLNQFKECLMRRWMISAVAAVLKPQAFKTRLVLTLQGDQGIGKTSWFASLVSDISLRESVIKLDQRMDAGDKDCVIAAATHWIVELGELEGSFRRNIDRLKGFLTNDVDKVRIPYARSASVFPRRTVFGASVNDDKFLVDPTGNTRWGVIPVTKINYNHGLDMQQVWAQVVTLYESGEQWWLTPGEEAFLEEQNRNYSVVSVVEERVMQVLDLTRKGENGLPAMTPSELLMRIGYKSVTNPQAKECAALLRRHLGESKRIRGSDKWRIPFAKGPDFVNFDDRY